MLNFHLKLLGEYRNRLKYIYIFYFAYSSIVHSWLVVFKPSKTCHSDDKLENCKVYVIFCPENLRKAGKSPFFFTIHVLIFAEFICVIHFAFGRFIGLISR